MILSKDEMIQKLLGVAGDFVGFLEMFDEEDRMERVCSVIDQIEEELRK